jgi:ferredoxin-NADP reductase
MTTWIDRRLGAVPMYRLVGMTLGALALVALVLTLTGALPFTAPELLASAAVAIVATVAASLLTGMVFRAKVHVESSAITGLLLLFLFQPSLDPTRLGALALAGAVAGASKFLLAVRGRHVFNPAALGAAVVALTQLDFALWWPGSAVMLPFVAVGALLVLYRTQRLVVGAVFVAVAVASLVVQAAVGGFDAVQALQTAFTSYPIVFLAGFMLSEPLTLPPRRWQQLVVAAVVGLLLAWPYSIGTVLYSSPELALLAGNAIAFVFGQRRGIRLAFLHKRDLGGGTWELAFEPRRPVRFTPGQYMELTLPHRSDLRGRRRYFSVSSAPSDGTLTFAVSVPEKASSFKRALLELRPGAEIVATGVGGDFALPTKPAEPVLLVAGGIGITPFASQLAHDAATGGGRDVVVVYATGVAGTPPYGELLERSDARVILFSPEPPDLLPPRWTWAGPDRADRESIGRHVPDVAGRRVYVSGPPALVDALSRAVRGLGARRVRRDAFSGY